MADNKPTKEKTEQAPARPDAGVNEERDFLRGISPPNDAPLTVAAMMQRKEERRGERGEERETTFNHLSCSDYLQRRARRLHELEGGGMAGRRWIERVAGRDGFELPATQY